MVSGMEGRWAVVGDGFDGAGGSGLRALRMEGREGGSGRGSGEQSGGDERSRRVGRRGSRDRSSVGEGGLLFLRSIIIPIAVLPVASLTPSILPVSILPVRPERRNLAFRHSQLPRPLQRILLTRSSFLHRRSSFWGGVGARRRRVDLTGFGPERAEEGGRAVGDWKGSGRLSLRLRLGGRRRGRALTSVGLGARGGARGRSTVGARRRAISSMSRVAMILTPTALTLLVRRIS